MTQWLTGEIHLTRRLVYWNGEIQPHTTISIHLNQQATTDTDLTPPDETQPWPRTLTQTTSYNRIWPLLEQIRQELEHAVRPDVLELHT